MNAQPGMGPNEGIFVAIVILVYLLIILTSVAITALIWCKLFSKAGYHWALGLLMFVPIANIVVPFYLAFAEWPIQRELRMLQQQGGSQVY